MNPMLREDAVAALTAAGQPYALADALINGRAVRIFVNAPASLRTLFDETRSDKPFLIYADEQWTFAEAWAAASRIAHVLVHECGVRHGDHVAIAMRNYPEWVLAFTAITSVGAIAVAMNAHWQSDEMAYGLRDCGARVVFADQERLDRLARAPAITGLQVLAVRGTRLETGVLALETLTAATGAVRMPSADIVAEDLATVLYTSGSTGHPKGVPSTQRNIVSALLSWELDKLVGERVAGLEPAKPDAQPGTLLAVPLFHVTGMHATYLSSYRLQRRMVCMYRWDAPAAATLIDQHRLTSVVAPAAMTSDLVRVARAGGHDLGSLLVLGGGGAPRAPEQVRQIAASFRQALPNTGWGMTETNSIGTSISGADYLGRPESSGRCSHVLQIKVVDAAGATLPAGQRGELLVRGTSVFGSYWNRPDANTQAFVGDWFRTGDVACIDAEGFLFIVDRIKDLIIRGGENIGCGEVEAAVLKHPDVLEVAVYAVPDARLGEEVGATVYSNGRLDLETLRSFLASQLAGFAVPRYIVFADAPLPRTPSGKVLKREIRAAALAAMGKTPG